MKVAGQLQSFERLHMRKGAEKKFVKRVMHGLNDLTHF